MNNVDYLALLSDEVDRRGERDPFGTTEKGVSRDRLLDFFKERHRPEPLRFLGFPSNTWRFESSMLREFPGGRIIGVEHRESTFIRSYLRMPGAPASVDYKTVAGCRLRVARNSNAVLFRTPLANLLTLSVSHPPEWFKRDVCGVTAAWLDFCGPVCPQSIHSLGMLPNILDLSGPVPVAVTLHNAREMRNIQLRERSAEGRVEALCKAIDQRSDVRRATVYVERYRQMLVAAMVIEPSDARNQSNPSEQ